MGLIGQWILGWLVCHKERFCCSSAGTNAAAVPASLARPDMGWMTPMAMGWIFTLREFPSKA